MEKALGHWKLTPYCTPARVNSLLFLNIRLCLKTLNFYAWFRVPGQIARLCRRGFSSEVMVLICKHLRSPWRPPRNQADSIFSHFQRKEKESGAKLWGPGPPITMRYFEWTVGIDFSTLWEIFHQLNNITDKCFLHPGVEG